jgi:cytoskeleton protein RodZ
VNEALGADADLAAARPAADGMGPGEMLALRRKERGLTLQEVAGRLKFGARQLEALEADDYERLPGLTFVRGMIKGYAKLLESDAEPMLHSLERRHVAAPVAMALSSKKIPFPDGRVRSTRVYLVLSVLLVLAVGGVLYEWQYGLPSAWTGAATPQAEPAAPLPQERVADRAESARIVPPAQPARTAPPRAPAPATAALPAAAAPAAAGPAPASGRRMTFEFHEESWVEVKDQAGQILMSQLNPAGSRRIIDGEPPFEIVIGNASSVRLTYRNAPVDLKPYIKVEVARLTLD